jgi:hypothetical protein
MILVSLPQDPKIAAGSSRRLLRGKSMPQLTVPKAIIGGCLCVRANVLSAAKFVAVSSTISIMWPQKSGLGYWKPHTQITTYLQTLDELSARNVVLTCSRYFWYRVPSWCDEYRGRRTSWRVWYGFGQYSWRPLFSQNPNRWHHWLGFSLGRKFLESSKNEAFLIATMYAICDYDTDGWAITEI